VDNNCKLPEERDIIAFYCIMFAKKNNSKQDSSVHNTFRVRDLKNILLNLSNLFSIHARYVHVGEKDYSLRIHELILFRAMEVIIDRIILK
jgi:hypothetical protein